LQLKKSNIAKAGCTSIQAIKKPKQSGNKSDSAEKFLNTVEKTSTLFTENSSNTAYY